MLQTPITTTTPDDVFYILKAVTTRLLTTGSVSAVEKTLQQLRDIIDRDYAGVIKRKSDDVYKNYSTPSNVRPDRVERENRVTFIVSSVFLYLSMDVQKFCQILLNDFDVSISHLERLIRDLCDSALITQHFIEEEQFIVKEKILSLSTLTTRLKSSLRVSPGWIIITTLLTWPSVRHRTTL
jgi:hypothetical protein